MAEQDIILADNQQPVLFTEEQWPRREDLLPLVAKYEHKAKAITKDENLCYSICEALTARGWSERETAKHFEVSRHTIHAMMAALEKSGKLAPLKQRISAKLAQVAELSLDAQIQALREGRVPANVLPIMTGVSLDKKAAADASGGAELPALAAPITPDDVRAAFAKIAKPAPVIEVPTRTTDSQSTGEPSNA